MNGVRKSSLAAVICMAFVAGIGPALAQQPSGTNDPGIQPRMGNQDHRIGQGVTTGALTPKETGRLQTEQARIQQAEERMKSDGNLTTKERQRLNTMQNKADGDIYTQNHDSQTAHVTPPAAPTVRQRQQNQQQRVQQGVRSGELTPQEVGRLEAEQARIQQSKERMRSDGELTGAERQKLNTMQDR
jgi:CRISPR/Cas system-associated endoribonuclease Cas2